MRKSYFTIAAMLLIVSAIAVQHPQLRVLSSNQTVGVGCLLYIDGAVYDLKDLKSDNDYR